MKHTTIGKVFVQTDSEYSQHEIGTVEGSFQNDLKDHIERHGSTGLYRALAVMQGQIFEAENEILREKSMENVSISQS